MLRIPLVGHHLERGRAEQEEERTAASNPEDQFVAKWEKHFLEGKMNRALEGEEQKRTLGMRQSLLPRLIDVMCKAGDPDVPQTSRKEDRGTLIHKMHADASHARPRSCHMLYTRWITLYTSSIKWGRRKRRCLHR